MTEKNSKEKTPEMIEQAADHRPKITETEGELVAVDTDHKTEPPQEKEAVEEDAKYKVEDAISTIMTENTCDYKDFNFPTNKMDILLYRMHHEINSRIQEFKEDNMEVEDIVTAYRNKHSKADDIEFITKTYKAMDLHNERVRPLPNPANKATATAGPPVATPSTSRAFLPVLFEPIGSQAAGLEPRERDEIKKEK